MTKELIYFLVIISLKLILTTKDYRSGYLYLPLVSLLLYLLNNYKELFVLLYSKKATSRLPYKYCT